MSAPHRMRTGLSAEIAARNAEILRLAGELKAPAEIERILGNVSRGVIYLVIAEARRKGCSIPKFSTAGGRRGTRSDRLMLNLPAIIGEVLAPHAERRKMTPGALAVKLLTLIADEDLVDAILDDGAAR